MTEGKARTALVTGITGQDGSYLAELLLQRGYRVVGTTRAHGTADTWRIHHLLARLELHALDLRDGAAVRGFVARVAPDEVYHLAAASRVDRSWERPMEALEANAGSTVHLMDALRHEAPRARMVIAASCEVFGRPDHSPQSESTPIRPASPYGVSKAAALWLAVNYRESHGLHVASAILYNHESPRRGEAFVTRKITLGVARIACGKERTLTLGNLDGRRDWGFAGDYMDALWRMQQLDAPLDLVVGSGVSHSVRDFCERAFGAAGLDYRAHVVSDEGLLRPVDATTLVADARLARERLEWRPTVEFPALVEMMVFADLERVRSGAGV